MQKADLPILYSFRRCPYAMRARLGIAASGQVVELREVVLRDKPAEMIEASPKATVPVLVLADGQVIDESFDIMHWALGSSDPEGLRSFDDATLLEMDDLITENDGTFKAALDRYKYPNRYEGVDRDEQRAIGVKFIQKLDARLAETEFLFGDHFSFADAAMLPFVRQFAHVDRVWFWAGDWKNTIRWLEAFLESHRFTSIMTKFNQWQSGEEGVLFGAQS